MNKNLEINQTFYYIIVSIVNFFIFSYIHYLEKNNCQCSKDWKRTFVKVVSIIIPLLLIAMITSSLALNNQKLALSILILYSLLSMVYTVVIISYFVKLNKCKCAEGFRRYFLIYPLTILVPLVLIIFLKLLFMSV